MSITRRSIEQLQEILQENLPERSTFVIAGGAARDLLCSKRPKDIDVFISLPQQVNPRTLENFRNIQFPFLQFNGSPNSRANLQNASYYTNSHIKVVYNYTYNFFINVQLIILNNNQLTRPILTDFVMRTFDLDICKAYFSPEAEPTATADFNKDLLNDNISLTYAHSREGYFKSVERAKRLIRTKFPGFRFRDKLQQLYIKKPSKLLADVKRLHRETEQLSQRAETTGRILRQISDEYVQGHISPSEFDEAYRAVTHTQFFPGQTVIPGFSYNTDENRYVRDRSPQSSSRGRARAIRPRSTMMIMDDVSPSLGGTENQIFSWSTSTNTIRPSSYDTSNNTINLDVETVDDDF